METRRIEYIQIGKLTNLIKFATVCLRIANIECFHSKNKTIFSIFSTYTYSTHEEIWHYRECIHRVIEFTMVLFSLENVGGSENSRLQLKFTVSNKYKKNRSVDI